MFVEILSKVNTETFSIACRPDCEADIIIKSSAYIVQLDFLVIFKIKDDDWAPCWILVFVIYLG